MSLIKPTVSLTSLEAFKSSLGGVLCVFKPANLNSKHVIKLIKTNLARDFNALLGSNVDSQYKLKTSTTELPSALVLATQRQSFVLGQRFTAEHFSVSMANPPGVLASGVMLIGVGDGNSYLEKFKLSKFLKVYEVKGVLGIATEDHTTGGRVEQKASFRHVRLEQLQRLLAAIQASHQRLQFESSGLDLRSQEAYELACRGLIRPPSGRSQPLIYSIKCTHFHPPDFTLEVQCIGDQQLFLTRLVHDLGLDLRCVAACRQLRVTRHGFYTLQHALLRSSWNAVDLLRHCQLCTQRYRENRKFLKESSTAPGRDSAPLIRHKPHS